MSKKYLWLVILIIIILGVVFWVKKIDHRQEVKEEEVIKVGAILPLSGDAAIWGERSRKGIELAVKEINNLGINGKKLEIIYEDDLSQASEATKVLQKLINVDKIKVIIGSVNSPETLAMAPIAEKNKVIIMAPGSASPEVTHAGDYIFRTRVSADVESWALVDKAFNNLQINNLALI